MKKRALALSVCCLSAGMTFTGAITAGAAEDADLTGEMIFAQCEEYINIRTEADADSEIVAKIYNNGAATVLEQEGDWYKITSGNAEGYVKAEYFATGEEAEQIAEKVAYHVAVVHPDDLNVRTSPSEDTDVIDVAHAKDELEVVAYDNDWMKVALGDDVYGYINAYYVDYKTYYPQAETLEEEQARLEAEAAQREAEAAWAEAAEEAAFETEWTESSYENETEAAWEDSSEASGSETEPVYTESAAAENTSGWTETGAENSGETYEDTGSDWTASDVTSDQTDAVYTETEAVSDQTEPTDTESGASDQTVETEAPVQESASTDSSLGQQIADYAVQFVGNPYVWGGTSLTSGADCSGFTQSVFANFGISLARVAADQSYGGTSVSLDSLQPGDLLFYSSSGSIDHVAIYIGSGMIVHAANSRTGITTSPYNYSTPVAARRYF